MVLLNKKKFSYGKRAAIIVVALSKWIILYYQRDHAWMQQQMMDFYQEVVKYSKPQRKWNRIEGNTKTYIERNLNV